MKLPILWTIQVAIPNQHEGWEKCNELITLLRKQGLYVEIKLEVDKLPYLVNSEQEWESLMAANYRILLERGK